MVFFDCFKAKVFLIVAILVQFDLLSAADASLVPAEIQLSGGDALGFANNGVATGLGSSAILVNPALLILKKQYRLRASYFWPSAGRELFQFGIVDGSTAKLAAGAQYTEFTEDYEYGGLLLNGDSPVKRRLSVGVAYPFAFFSLGMSAHYTEAYREENLVLKPYRGVTLGLGLLAKLTEDIRFGLSLTHFNNSKLRDVSPLFVRGGLAWDVVRKVWEVFIDFRQRDRIARIEGPLPLTKSTEDVPQSVSSGFSDPERMISLGSRVVVYDLIELGLSYGQAISVDKRQELGARAALVHEEYSLSYNVTQASVDEARLDSALSFSLLMKM